MKTVAVVLVSFLFMISTAIAGVHEKKHKRPVNNVTVVNERINGMLGNPDNLLNGHSQSAMISYSIDQNNIIHVQEVATANAELKKYITKHLDGKKINNSLHDQSGIVKVHFNAYKADNLYISY